MKKLIKFYKKNKAISNIGFIAWVIALSYAITYNMPDYFGIESYYSLANNICISYIAALIFYVVQVYIPEDRNQKKCMEILKNKFADITKFNEIAVLLCEKHISMNENRATINWNGDEEKIYLKVKASDKADGPELIRYTKKELLNWKNTFNEKLKVIKESAVINYCDYEVLEKLSEIEKQDFFTLISNIIRFSNSDIGIQGVEDSIKRFKRINEKLKQMCSISEHYQLMDVSKDDIIRMDIIFRNFINNTFSILAFNREFIKAKIEEELRNKGVEISEQEIEKMCDAVMEANDSK